LILIDSNIAVHLLAANAEVGDRIAAMTSLPCISAVSRAELEGGVYRVDVDSTIEDRRRALDEFVRRVTILDFTADVAAVYGRIAAAAGYSRRKILDRMIAATALHHGLGFATFNARDFRDIPGLAIVDLAAAA
jgi:tRNA(fMet)-specific endonuclease VapC